MRAMNILKIIPAALRNRLVHATGAGALAIAALLVMHFEGLQHYPYRDTGGVITVCVGHTGADIVWGRYYSTQECDAILKKDLATGERIVARAIHQPIPDYLRGALISFAFNVGEGQFRTSTLVRKINARDLSGGCAELRRWIFDNGKKLNGLVNRREAELWVCEGMPQ